MPHARHSLFPRESMGHLSAGIGLVAGSRVPSSVVNEEGAVRTAFETNTTGSKASLPRFTHGGRICCGQSLCANT